MNPSDIIAIALSLAVIGIAVCYIIRQKKKGNHCIGCPSSASCPHRSCGCCHK